MIVPQRGSINYFQNALGLIHCGTPLGHIFFAHSTQCALPDTGLRIGTALQFIVVWPPLMCFPVLCSRGPTRQPHRNRGVKPLLQLKTTIFRSGSVLKWRTSCLCVTARRQGEMSALLSLNSELCTLNSSPSTIRLFQKKPSPLCEQINGTPQ